MIEVMFQNADGNELAVIATTEVPRLGDLVVIRRLPTAQAEAPTERWAVTEAPREWRLRALGDGSGSTDLSYVLVTCRRIS